ncbi:MAG: hypothetical protein V9F06_00200 [Thermomicrobiales bacterium]
MIEVDAARGELLDDRADRDGERVVVGAEHLHDAGLGHRLTERAPEPSTGADEAQASAIAARMTAQRRSARRREASSGRELIGEVAHEELPQRGAVRVVGASSRRSAARSPGR